MNRLIGHEFFPYNNCLSSDYYEVATYMESAICESVDVLATMHATPCLSVTVVLRYSRQRRMVVVNRRRFDHSQ